MNVRLSLLVLSLLLAAPGRAGEPSTLVQVSQDPSLAGLQMQRPVWAPGDQPKLVHEASDRSRRSFLRVVRPEAPASSVTVPATRSARLGALGVGADRADLAASWWDGEGFFFVRSAGDAVTAHYWDGVLRGLDDPPGRPVAITRDPSGRSLLVTMEDAQGFDLFRFSGTDLAIAPTRLTRTPAEVEHGLTPLPDGRVALIAASRESTRLLLLDGAKITSVAMPAGVELLSLAALSDGALLAWARPAEGDGHHLLWIDTAGGRPRTLMTDGYLPPGVAPRPAVSHVSGWIYAVRFDAAGANPIVRFKADSPAPRPVALATSAHQEVAVASYPGPAGPRDWLAVVAVGDAAGGDLANHLYVGPAPDGDDP